MEATHEDPLGLAGTVLERKYRVDRLVAEGGFGLVYRGHHMALDQAVALKVLKRRTDLDNDAWQDLLTRFVQEAQTMARLRHPHVVAVLDTGVAQIGDAPLPWMVLEWLEGRTLKEDLAGRRGRGGRAPREALELMRPVITAVAEAHHARVAHRDLKPSNIMLVPGRRGGTSPRVLDFGIAKVVEGDTQASSGHTTTDDSFRAFSLGYAAPEQIAGARTGPWTDVHALGLVLTEVLADAAPYSDEPTEQHARAFDPVRPTPARFGVDAGPLERVIARAVALKPADRYADAGELLAALDAALTQRTTESAVVREAREHGTASGAPRAVRRSRRGWTLAGIVGVTGACATVVAMVRHAGRADATAGSPSAPQASAVVTVPAPAVATTGSMSAAVASADPSARPADPVPPPDPGLRTNAGTVTRAALAARTAAQSRPPAPLPMPAAGASQAAAVATTTAAGTAPVPADRPRYVPE